MFALLFREKSRNIMKCIDFKRNKTPFDFFVI